MSSSQNERTLAGGGVLENEQGQARGRGVKTRKSHANMLFECPLKRHVKRSALKKNCICIWIGLINLYNSEAVTETCSAK